MNISLIITTYNRPEALALVLDSVLMQTELPGEIIIADDGSTGKTRLLIENYTKKSKVPIKHIWHKDEGFRVAKIRNRAIKNAEYEYIISIDGDIVLHKEFIKSHIINAEKGVFLQGHRVMLGKSTTVKALNNGLKYYSFFHKDIKNRKNTIHDFFLAKLFSKKSMRKKGLKGGIMSFWKQDAININGYNEDFEGWGKEDSEFGIRLFNSGIIRKDLRFCAVSYHLDHDNSSKTLHSKSYERNLSILQNTIEKKLVKCKNGLEKL